MDTIFVSVSVTDHEDFHRKGSKKCNKNSNRHFIMYKVSYLNTFFKVIDILQGVPPIC